MASDPTHTYSLALKVSGWEVSFFSPDAAVMQRQMGLWFPSFSQMTLPKQAKALVAPQPETKLVAEDSAEARQAAAKGASLKASVRQGMFDEPVFSGPLLEAVEPFPELEKQPAPEPVLEPSPEYEVEPEIEAEELPDPSPEAPAAPEASSLSSVDLPAPFQPLASDEALEDELDWPEDESTEAIEASLLQAATVVNEPETDSSQPNSLDAVLESIFEDLGSDDDDTQEPDSLAVMLPQPFAPAVPDQPMQDEPEATAETMPLPPLEPSPPQASFTEESLRAEPASVYVEQDLPLETLLERADLKSMDEMLALTAYFLSTRQNEPHVSLKRLNETITELGYASFTHGDMELAVNQQWLAVVPDKNSFTEATLYELTEQGRYFSEQQLGG